MDINFCLGIIIGTLLVEVKDYFTNYCTENAKNMVGENKDLRYMIISLFILICALLVKVVNIVLVLSCIIFVCLSFM